MTHTPVAQLQAQVHKLIAPYKLHQEDKGFTGYYMFRGKKKKILLYLNPGRKDLIFGASHRSTTLLDSYPMLKISADETKKATIKRKIKDIADIKNKGIETIIRIVVEEYKKMGYQ